MSPEVQKLNTLRRQLDGLAHGDPRANVEAEIAELLIRNGDYGQALVHLGGARRATSDARLRERLELLTGIALLRRGEVDRAEPHLERQLEGARGRRDLEAEARSLMYLGEIYRRRGEAARSSRALERARSYFESHPDGAAIATIYTSLAEQAIAAGDLDGAGNLAGRAVELAQGSSAAAAEAAALLVVGELARRREEFDDSETAISRAIDLVASANLQRELAEAYFAYGHLVGHCKDKLDTARVGSAATWIARAQELFREHGALADLERVREAFRHFGRRATDQVAAHEVRELTDELRNARLNVAREVHKLIDAVEQGLGRVEADMPPPTRAKLHNITAAAVEAERAVTTGVEALSSAEGRVLGAVQSMVVERENIRTLLDLCRSLNALGDYGRLVSEICKMSAQLTGADRCLVAILENGRLEVRASLRMPEVQSEAAWRDAVDAVLKGGGPTLVQPSNKSSGAPERGDDIRLGHALTTPLRQGDKLFGAVYVDKELCGGVFTPHDLDLLSIFSAQAATMLENARVAEELRIASRARAATLEAISDGVLSLDKRGKITSINAVAARILGTSISGSLKDLHDLAFLRATLEHGEELDGRVTRVGNGEYLCNARVIRSDTNEIVGAVMTLTEMKRAQSIAQRIVGSPARYSFGDMIGQAPSLRRRLQLAEAAARSDSSLLVTGESGTGKEVLAQAVHNASPRASGPFVGINCSAIPRELLESELFGYEGGAFTGAKRGGHPGKFELAEGGTILLDEIGDMPIEMQAKLLRVLQERRVHRIGGTREVELNARVIATTNRDLDEESEKGRFRRDLLFRLKVIHIQLPALRERTTDIPLLVAHYLGLFTARLGKQVRAVAPHVMEAFMRYQWPGNIRELENVLEAEVNVANEGQTVLDQVPEGIRPRPSADGGANRSRIAGGNPRTFEESERDMLVQALAENGGSIPDVARQLGISRGTVYNKLRRFAVDAEQYRVK
ncbi:MAG: Sigma-54 dependent transcriptional regulator [Myxococcales bacterium]|nr:Sigma-54 dependent transcriptional regulator [Myxococcales bacterium]